MIKVEKKDADQFLVVVQEEDSKTEHNVELDDQYYQIVTAANITKEDFIKKSFQFLLKREPKESILSKFNLRIIESYFPGYKEEMKKGL